MKKAERPITQCTETDKGICHHILTTSLILLHSHPPTPDLIRPWRWTGRRLGDISHQSLSSNRAVYPAIELTQGINTEGPLLTSMLTTVKAKVKKKMMFQCAVVIIIIIFRANLSQWKAFSFSKFLFYVPAAAAVFASSSHADYF